VKPGAARRSGRRRSDRATLCAALTALGFTVVALVVLGRTLSLMLRPPQPIAQRLAAREEQRRQPPLRQVVLDRLGRPLALTVPAWRAILDPAAVEEGKAEQVAAALCRALDEPCEALRQRVREAVARSRARVAAGRAPLRYVRLRDRLDQAQVEALRAVASRAVWVERYAARTTTVSDALAPLLGKVGADGQGLLGVEALRDEALRGEQGAMRVVRDAWGRPLWLEARQYTPPKPGKPVQLSLDLALQRIVEEELARGVEEADAAGGRAIVVEPMTGRVLALADTLRCPPEAVEPPDGPVPPDASAAAGGVRYRGFDCERPSAEPALRRLRTLEDVYEPGSTFKPFIWSAITELGLLDPADEVDTESGLWRTPYGRRIEDVVKRDRQSWEDVLVNSSNIGMVKAAALLTPKQLREAIVSFGFGSRTGLGLQTEAPGLVTPLSRWTQHTHSSVAFGQEVGVTAAQMARAFCALARQGELAGTLPQLSLLEEPRDSPLLVRVLSPTTVGAVRRALRRLAERVDERLLREGALAAPLRYSMFGKSGTADLPHPRGHGYLKGQYVSSFIAAAPADAPRLVALVVIDDPGPATIAARRHYGSWTAGPVVRRIVERALPYLGVAPDRVGSPSVREGAAQAAAPATDEAG